MSEILRQRNRKVKVNKHLSNALSLCRFDSKNRLIYPVQLVSGENGLVLRDYTSVVTSILDAFGIEYTKGSVNPHAKRILNSYIKTGNTGFTILKAVSKSNQIPK